MIEIKILIFLVAIHTIADFVVQTDWQAKNKYKDNEALAYHVFTYSLTFLFTTIVILPDFRYCILFAIITFVCHYITDYFTSKVSHTFFKENKINYGFRVIGFDQLLHIIQLILTYKLLTL